MNEWEIQEDNSDELVFGIIPPKSRKLRSPKKTDWDRFVDSVRHKIPINWDHEEIRPYMVNSDKMPSQICLHAGCKDYLKARWNWDEIIGIWTCQSCDYPIMLNGGFTKNKNLYFGMESGDNDDSNSSDIPGKETDNSGAND